MSNYLEKAAGQKIYELIQNTPEANRDSITKLFDAKYPGIAAEINLSKGLDTLNTEALLRGFAEDKQFGTKLGVTPDDVLQLRQDIDATKSSIADLHKTTVDEHLTVIEHLSGVTIAAEETTDGEPVHDSVFSFMKEAERKFNASLENESPSRKKRLMTQFYTSYDTLWPKEHMLRSSIRISPNIDSSLEALYDLSKTLEGQEGYYEGYFTSPEDKTTYEQEVFGE